MLDLGGAPHSGPGRAFAPGSLDHSVWGGILGDGSAQEPWGLQGQPPTCECAVSRSRPQEVGQEWTPWQC